MILHNISEEREGRILNGLDVWVGYWRANPHRFTIDYLGIKLKFFQQILLYLAFMVDYFVFIAARGLGKSWLIAVLCCVRCILYPRTKIVLASGTKGQAKLIITEKITDLKNMYPNLDIEIKDIKTGNNEVIVEFKNGSTISAVASNDNARGYRANIIVLDEFRLIKEKTFLDVLRPFLNYARDLGCKSKPEYKNYEEGNKEIYISSAWYKSDWSWLKFEDYFNLMLGCKENSWTHCAVAFPYTLSIFHGLLTRKQVENQKKEKSFNKISWAMEMEAIFYGENETSLFKLDELQQCRIEEKAFYPRDTLTYLQDKKKKRKTINYYEKKEGEIRIISADIATMKGDNNDNSVFTCFRAIPEKDGYIRSVPYIETHNGEMATEQAVRLQQLYRDFEADYIVIDCGGVGQNVYDDLTRVLKDKERDEEYNGLKSFNSEEMAERAKDPNAKPYIYTIKAAKNNSINSDIALELLGALESKKINFLVNEIDAEQDFKQNDPDYRKLSPHEQVLKLLPYTQTTSFINEIINLTCEYKNGKLDVREVGRNRKDRYSSMAYGNYLISVLEQDLVKPKEENNVLDYCSFGYATGKII